MTQEQSQKLKLAIQTAVRETNRCTVNNALRFSVRHMQNEVYALFKTWLCREVRPIIGYSAINTLTDRNRMSLVCLDYPAQIIGVHFDIPSWIKDEDIAVQTKDICKEIVWKDLLYKGQFVPSYDPTNYSKQTELSKLVDMVDLTDIANFKFS